MDCLPRICVNTQRAGLLGPLKLAAIFLSLSYSIKVFPIYLKPILAAGDNLAKLLLVVLLFFQPTERNVRELRIRRGLAYLTGAEVGQERAVRSNLTEMKKRAGAGCFHSTTRTVVLAMFLASLGAAQQDAGINKDLIQWVKDARQGGMAEEEIRKNAALAGWTDNAVIEALRATAPEPAKGATGAVTPAPATAPAVPATVRNEPPKNEPPKLGPSNTTPGQITGDPASQDQRPTPGAVGPLPLAPGTTPPAAATADTDAKTRVDHGVPADYLIGAGDILHISVFHEPDATVAGVVVRPDGKISMPLLKEVSVVGLTPSQLEKQITTDLSQFMAAPDVTVMVTAINSKKIYVVGAVKKEGPIPYTYRMNVLQALSEAGGITDYAKRKKIYVLRNENGRDFKLAFDYDKVLKGEHMELNIPLMAGDTLVVPN